MASLLFVTEYSALASSGGSSAAQAPMEPSLSSQIVNFAAGATASVALQPRTRFVRVHSDTACFIAFGTNPTAVTANSMRLSAGATEIFGVPENAGFKISAVA